VSMVYISCGNNSTRETFAFTFSAASNLHFSFDRPKPVPVFTTGSFKRRRALSDVDGDGNEGRKKRRLRLYLITSRLSRPFSQPATNIVNRGVSKIAVWGKNKALGRNVLRKAAIMNAVRLRIDVTNAIMRPGGKQSRDMLALRDIVVPKPRCFDMPLPPSPLGLSNYDAFDLEDEMGDANDEGGSERCSSIYSDFNIMNPTSIDGDTYDYLDALDGISSKNLPDNPPPPFGENIVDVLRDKDREVDAYFVRVGE